MVCGRQGVMICRHTLQHTATHEMMRRRTLQHIATHCNILQHIATHCNTLQHIATHEMMCGLKIQRVSKQRVCDIIVHSYEVSLTLCQRRTMQCIQYMGWLRLVGSFKLLVSFAKESHKRDYILQKRPII